MRRGWGLRLGRGWLAWSYDFLGLSFTEKKSILREISWGVAPPATMGGARYLLARSLTMALDAHPGVFLAFPVAMLVILGNVAAYWIKVFVAFF